MLVAGVTRGGSEEMLLGQALPVPSLLVSGMRQRRRCGSAALLSGILQVLFICVRFENANEVLKAAQRLKY